MANRSCPDYTSLLIIPTGVGAAIGGFAGDAIPVVRTLASCVDHLITHPNVLNGAMLFWPLANTYYVEGYALDQWCAGAWSLQPRRQNRVGVIFDAALEPDLRLRHEQVIGAAQATLGLVVGPTITTTVPLGIEITQAPSGASRGTLRQPDALLEAGRTLHAQGAEAIAIIGRFPDDLDFSGYDQGQGVDPLAGIEAIISHLLVRELNIPCAHAPALRHSDPPQPIHPRAAAEELGFTFLPCVLAGLSYAPQFVAGSHPSNHGLIDVGQLDSVIAPATACGSPALLALAERQRAPLLIAVQENTTVMQVSPVAIGYPNVITVNSYAEAVGVVAAHRAGVDPRCLFAG